MPSPTSAREEILGRIEVLEKDSKRDLQRISDLQREISLYREGVRQIEERAQQWRDILGQIQKER